MTEQECDCNPFSFSPTLREMACGGCLRIRRREMYVERFVPLILKDLFLPLGDFSQGSPYDAGMRHGLACVVTPL